MNVSLFQAAAALNSNTRWQEMIAENLASSSIPGFKKQELSVAAVQAGLMPQSALNSPNVPQSFAVPVATGATNFQPGELKFTGDKNDVAIEGPGFFAVQLPDGSTAQTRNGEFQVSAQGELVTNEGYAVLGDAGPIQMDLTNPEPMSISATGVVSQGADEKGKLKLTEFDHPELLTQITAGYFLANNPKLVGQASQSTVRQGYVESSNVSSVIEMSNLITAMRSFEANQRIIQIQDDRMGKVISDLGNPN
jgi:flagellar basal-body rod protein FlgG